MRDHHHHHSPDNTGFCEQCGQPLQSAHVLSYGERKPFNRTGIAVAILVHVLVALLVLFKPKVDQPVKPERAGGEITYVAPLKGKPKPKESAPTAHKQPKVSKSKPRPAPPVQIKRLPDAITLPSEKPVVEQPEPEPPQPKAAPPEMDMAAAIEARRKARGQDNSDQTAQESDADRGMRLAKANIAAANGKAQGDGNGSGGIFDVSNKTFASAELKFNGWSKNFQRRWLQQVTVERGSEPDIETAIVKKMIELIRKEKPGDFDWNSHRLQRVVKMSARPADQAELEAFLFKEMFPEYRRAGR